MFTVGAVMLSSELKSGQALVIIVVIVAGAFLYA